MNPAVGGMPTKDIIDIAITPDNNGARFATPAKSDINSLLILLLITIMAKNTAKFVAAYPAR